MKTATKTLIAIVAMTATLSATTLSANAAPMSHNDRPNTMQRPDMHRPDMRASTDLRDRIEGLRTQITQGQRSQRLTRMQATRLTKSVDDLAALKRTYERSGNSLSRTEISKLQNKVNLISKQIQTQLRDRTPSREHNRR